MSQKLQLTFIIIKPHVLKHPYARSAIHKIIKENFKIVVQKEIKFSKNLAQKFYEEHQGKFFYNRLVTFMSSDPSEVLIVSAENAIEKWRSFLGNTKVYKTIFTGPDSIRGLYGLTDTRNACHGSDSEQSVKDEIKKILPDFDVDKWNLQNSMEIGAGCRVNLF